MTLWRAAWPSTRTWVVLLLAVAGVWAFWLLGLGPDDLLPGERESSVAWRFLAAAFQPAVDYEDPLLRRIGDPYLGVLAHALFLTVSYAAAAIVLSTVGGVVFGFLASGSFWAGDPGRPRGLRPWRWLGRAVQGGVRVLIGLLRSVHELMWAMLFSAAFGLQPITAVIALALPYTGYLAKIWSEMLDEAPGATSEALHGLGARPLQVFLFGRLPSALPDMAAYGFYRLECGVRSSVVLGFFGVETLGKHIKQSFHELHFHEVWTCLDLILVVVFVLEGWSGRLRRRMVA